MSRSAVRIRSSALSFSLYGKIVYQSMISSLAEGTEARKGVDLSTEVGSAVHTEGPHLRRELRLWEAVAISLALMAPSMAANINPQGTAGSVGRAVPLAFALATIGVLLIAWVPRGYCSRSRATRSALPARHRLPED